MPVPEGAADVVATYAAMESDLARAGLPRHRWEAPASTSRARPLVRRAGAAADDLTGLYEVARFGPTPPGPADSARARAARAAVAAALPPARKASPPPERA